MNIILKLKYRLVFRCFRPSFKCVTLAAIPNDLFVLQAEEDDDIGISDSQAAMLEAKIDPVEWKRELERVGPRLKVTCESLELPPSQAVDYVGLSCVYNEPPS